MDGDLRRQILGEQIQVARAAARVLEESHARVGAILSLSDRSSLSIEQRESCEALTSRFARLCDLLVQRLFRTIDQIELVDDGTILDRLARMEKREIVSSAEEWRELRELRNEIAHDYLIESSDRELLEAHRRAPILLAAVGALEAYVGHKRYLDQ